MTCEIANVMTETPIITAAIPTTRFSRKPRNRMAPPSAYLLIAAKSVQSIGLHANPFTLDRRPKGSVGWYSTA